VEAAASITFGAGQEPAVTKPSIWPFLQRRNRVRQLDFGQVHLAFKTEQPRYFSPSRRAEGALAEQDGLAFHVGEIGHAAVAT
jgi:hypothetical protein